MGARVRSSSIALEIDRPATSGQFGQVHSVQGVDPDSSRMGDRVEPVDGGDHRTIEGLAGVVGQGEALLEVEAPHRLRTPACISSRAITWKPYHPVLPDQLGVLTAPETCGLLNHFEYRIAAPCPDVPLEAEDRRAGGRDSRSDERLAIAKPNGESSASSNAVIARSRVAGCFSSSTPIVESAFSAPAVDDSIGVGFDMVKKLEGPRPGLSVCYPHAHKTSASIASAGAQPGSALWVAST